MKIQISLLLGAVAVLSGAANAQTVQDNGDGVQLCDIPKSGELFPFSVEIGHSEQNPLFGPDMPPVPKREFANNTKLKLSVLKSPKGDIVQLEANNQSRAAILKKITDVMGARAIIDPKLEKELTITQVFRGLSWDELLASVNFGVEMVKSPAGTYFFAAKSTGLTFNYSPQLYDYAAEQEKLRQDPRFDPFIFPRGGLNPKDQMGRPIEPQPHWEKREFNGHDFYYIPGLPQLESAK